MRTTARRGIGWSTAAVMLLLFFAAGPAYAGKVDPFWTVQKEMIEKNVSSGKAAPGALLIEVFIKSTDVEKTKGRVEAGGGNVRTIVGNIMTASLPEKAIIDAESWNEVEYIEAAKPMRPLNDVANVDTGVNLVHAGTGFTQGYDGTGVIVGVIDSGIDLTHPAFLDADGVSRVLYVWDQQDTTGPGPTEISSTYGTEHNHDAIVAGITGHQDTSGHGTHVAGTAAGRDSLYPGVAQGASIIVVKNTYTRDYLVDSMSTTVSDAAYYIFEKARQLGMPAVINMSLGSHYGAHDGTSIFEQYLDALVASSSAKSIVVSAGNSADPLGLTTVGNHIGYTVTASKDVGSTFYPKVNRYPSPYIIELWEEPDCSEVLQIGLYAVGVGLINWSGAVDIGGSETGNWGPMVYGIDRTETSSALNGMNHTIVAIFPDAGFDAASLYFDIAFSGNCSRLDAWTDPYSTHVFGADSGVIGGIEYHPGDSVSTVMAPGTASKVITVGAYITRTNWTDSGGTAQSDPLGLLLDLNELAFFSSRGPALEAAQGTKPNIAAPGSYLISAYSANTASVDATMLIDSQHVAMAGTSMASPHVAGIVALLFQAEPTLTGDQVMSYLQSTARADGNVGAAPNADWGYGKVDADAALTAVLADYPPEPPTPPTPSDGGGGGCNLTPTLHDAIATEIAMGLITLAVAIGLRRRLACKRK